MNEPDRAQQHPRVETTPAARPSRPADPCARRPGEPAALGVRFARARLLFLRRREMFANWLALLVLVSLGVVWPPAFGQGLAPESARTGTLLLKSSPDAEAIEALRVATRMRAQVTANVARVQVSQRFENPTDAWVEGLYVFPLPAGAAVDELQMRIGERTIRGEIQPRKQAHAIYEQARREGRQASLVDQERPNMFTTAVANIAPRSAITVQIAYLDVVPLRDGHYTLTLPLAITPRYTPGAPLDPAAPLPFAAAVRTNARLGSTATPEKVSAARQQVDIEVQLAPGFALESVRSLHHPVAIGAEPLGRRITLSGAQIAADRDFELVWTPAAGTETQVAAFTERAGEDTYALLVLTPPEAPRDEVPRREVIFIIDTSGSMSGASLEQARAALALGVERLAPADRFDIIRFSNDATRLFRTPQPADAAARDVAYRFIASLEAGGGTQMHAALTLAFATPPPRDALRQIVFITDGSVGNEAELVGLIHRRIGAARLFTVGIGAAPNAWFMREAAGAGRGSYTFIARPEQVRERMQELFAKLERPALVDLELHWPRGAQAELAAPLPADLYAGDPLVVVARLAASPAGLLTLAGRSHAGAWVRQVPLTTVEGQAGIGKLWARERIADLTRRKHYGAAAPQLEAQILELALAHHLVSDLTSLVAVDVTPVRPAGVADHLLQAPTAAPAGSYWARSTGFPATATPAPLLALLGLGLLALAAAACLTGGPLRVRSARARR